MRHLSCLYHVGVGALMRERLHVGSRYRPTQAGWVSKHRGYACRQIVSRFENFQFSFSSFCSVVLTRRNILQNVHTFVWQPKPPLLPTYRPVTPATTQYRSRAIGGHPACVKYVCWGGDEIFIRTCTKRIRFEHANENFAGFGTKCSTTQHTAQGFGDRGVCDGVVRDSAGWGNRTKPP